MSHPPPTPKILAALETVHCPPPTFTFPANETWSLQDYKWTPPSTLHSRIKDATVVLTATVPFTSTELSPDITPHLRLIQCMGTGTNHIDLTAAAARGIRVCNTPAANIDSVSEHAVALYFAARRRVVVLHNALTDFGAEGEGRGRWKETGSLGGALVMGDGTAPLGCGEEVMGIVGYGALGKRIEGLGKALGMTVVIAERKGGPPSDGERGSRVAFEDVLKRSTVLVLCCPLNKETINMISTEELATMLPHSLIINVSRGGIVDEQAVLAALKQQSIAGYATDVFGVEPAGRGDSALLSDEAKGLNITMSPHIAWCSRRTLENLKTSWKKTVEAWFRGEDINVIV